MRLLVSYSGGKDSTLAMYKAIKQNHEIKALFTTISIGDKSWFHDINVDLLSKASQQMGFSFETIYCKEGSKYTEDFEKALITYKDKYQAEGVVFGDIDLQAHRDWCEKRCFNCGLIALFPLWNENRRVIVEQFIKLGFKTIIKRVKKDDLSNKYLGRVLDYELLDEFEKLAIDVCGENGEYHTLVYDGPIYQSPIPIVIGDVVEFENSYSIDISLNE